MDKQKMIKIKDRNMRDFSYHNKWTKLLTPQIVNYLTAIHEYKGRQELIATRHADVLQNLIDIARIQSTESSNKWDLSANQSFLRVPLFSGVSLLISQSGDSEFLPPASSGLHPTGMRP